MNTNLSTLLNYVEILSKRDECIYKAFQDGARQKMIANMTGLSESRVKAICAEQRKKGINHEG